MSKRKSIKGQTIIYKLLHTKLKIEQYEPHWKLGVNSCAPEELAVPAPLVTPIAFLQTGDKPWMRKEPDFEWNIPKHNIFSSLLEYE
jgi:hypothetical protein